MNEVTQILSKIESGDQSAAERLLPMVYDELRSLAAAKLLHEQPGQTFQATSLVHEAYVRLVDVEKAQHWNSRGHFFAAAAEAMRRILVEQARRRRRIRHGGQHRRLDLDDWDPAAPADDEHVLEVDEALEQLALVEPTIAEIVKLRYFAGLTIEQAAAAVGISVRTANRHWSYAKAWLFQNLQNLR